MLRFVVAAVAVAAVALPAVAAAEPVVPQPGLPCGANLGDAMTWPSDGTAPLACVGGPAGYQWETVDSPYPISDRWVSFGPPMKLHGEGLRNAAIKSGDWTATPLDPDSRCGAEQLAVIPGVGAGPPQDVEGEPGQPLSLQVVPLLFSIEMTGNCLWQKVTP
ncbi:hypothetical protein [Mycolicibacterium sp. P9-64]|uniref:hypothetical protein n=1 Tax=Mycolicibacterium sp. P9-64 TaxID=2024612 RepID=UPI001F5BAD04|nr:hypothetical protein [Mycolicibacterium sp. P9-64]